MIDELDDDVSCESLDARWCIGCSSGTACLRATPEAMAKRKQREEWYSVPASEPTLFDRLVRSRRGGIVTTTAVNEMLKRIYSMSAPSGTYERCLTFKSMRRFDDRVAALRGTRQRTDKELAAILGIQLVGALQTLSYRMPAFLARAV